MQGSFSGPLGTHHVKRDASPFYFGSSLSDKSLSLLGDAPDWNSCHQGTYPSFSHPCFSSLHVLTSLLKVAVSLLKSLSSHACSVHGSFSTCLSVHSCNLPYLSCWLLQSEFHGLSLGYSPAFFNLSFLLRLRDFIKASPSFSKRLGLSIN